MVVGDFERAEGVEGGEDGRTKDAEGVGGDGAARCVARLGVIRTGEACGDADTELAATDGASTRLTEDEEDYFGGGMEMDDHEKTLNGRGKRVMERWKNEKVKKGVTNGSSGRRRRVYGREFAVKVLSKRDLDEDALRSQMVEVSFSRLSVIFVS